MLIPHDSGFRFGMTQPLQMHLPQGYPGLPARLQAKRMSRLPVTDRTALFRNPDGSGGHPAPGDTFAMALNPKSFRGRTAERYIYGLPNIWNDATATATSESQVLGDGVYRVYSSDGSNTTITNSSTLVIGQVYFVEFAIDSEAVPGSGVRVGNTGGIFTGVGPHSTAFVADSTSAFIKRNSGATDIQISGLSFKHIPDAPWVAPSTEAALTLQQHPAGDVRNLLFRNVNIASASDQWSVNNAVVTNGHADLFGGADAFLLTENTASAISHNVRVTPSIATTDTHTASVIAKAKERSIFTLLFRDNDGNTHRSVDFDLSAGTLRVAGTGLPGSESIEHLGNGWYLCVVTATPISRISYFDFRMSEDTTLGALGGTGDSYDGDGTSGMYFLFPQLELGSIATARQKVVNRFWVEEDGQQPVLTAVSDGADDTMGLEVDGTGEANSTAYMMVKTTSLLGVLLRHSVTSWRGVWTKSSPTALIASHGDPVITIDGMAFNQEQDWDDVANVIADGEWHFVKLPILNFMNTAGTIYVNGHPNYEWLGETIGPIIVPDSEISPALEQAIEDELRYAAGQNPAYVEPWDVEGLMLYPDFRHESAVLSGLDGAGGPAEHGSAYSMIVDRADLKNQMFDEYLATLPNAADEFTNPLRWGANQEGITDNGDGTLTIADVGGSDGQLSFQVDNDVDDWIYVSVNITSTDASTISFRERNSLGADVAIGVAKSASVGRFYEFRKATYANSHVAFQVQSADTSATISDFELKVIPATIWTAPSTEGSPTLGREPEDGVRNIFPYSNDLGQFVGPGGGTVLSGGVTDINGRASTLLTEDSANGEHNKSMSPPGVQAVPGTSYLVSADLKPSGAGSKRYFGIRGFGLGDPGFYPVFDVDAGEVFRVGSGFDNAGIIGLGDGWWRCWALVTAADIWNPIFHLQETPGIVNYQGDGSSGLYIANAHWQEGTEYQPPQFTNGPFDIVDEGKRPLVYSRHDGEDDKIIATTPSKPSSANIFVVLEVDDFTFGIVSGGAGSYIGAADAGSNPVVSSTAGDSLRYFVGGVEVFPAHRTEWRNSFNGKGKVILEFRDADLSAGWGTFEIGDIGTAPYELNGKVYAVLVFDRVLTGMDRVNVYRHLRNLIGE